MRGRRGSLAIASGLPVPGAVVRKVVGPGLHVRVGDVGPCLAFPSPKIHFCQVGVDSRHPIGPRCAQVLRQRRAALQRRDFQCRGGGQNCGQSKGCALIRRSLCRHIPGAIADAWRRGRDGHGGQATNAWREASSERQGHAQVKGDFAQLLCGAQAVTREALQAHGQKPSSSRGLPPRRPASPPRESSRAPPTGSARRRACTKAWLFPMRKC
jgi:hypothetical protein